MTIVRAVTSAFAILRYLAKHQHSLSLTDIARGTATSPSSCLNLLRTLVAEGAVTASTEKRYGLAPGWRSLSGLVESELEKFITRIQPMLDDFARDGDVATGLWRIDLRGRVELIALGESSSPMRIHMVVGQRQPLGAGSVGRAIAAAEDLSEATLAERFAGLRWRGPITFAKYVEQVRSATAKGYAIDNGLAFVGICSVASAVPSKVPAFCLSASGFAGQRDARAIAALGEGLTELARASAQLGS